MSHDRATLARNAVGSDAESRRGGRRDDRRARLHLGNAGARAGGWPHERRRHCPRHRGEPEPAAPPGGWRVAVADAVQRTGASPTEIAVERVEAHEWPDRSLGCPKPGLGYAQVLTLGYIVVLQARGQRFEYHTDQAQVTLCTP